ncbi:pyridoxal phosphate-dependent decarboxylase family protein [Polyangium jinanense]|uniref:Aminotransferase class I/II-fold pyridoxal phosphate-dependent enzyme n=1 Tax=Polyangium jinanense TaxID=2829994 RepID=A0A9X3XHE4_9BACT|nr:aminotransferase class I/II-fold pyridoxal phosphate-dependent enzyme [Polyangium jinanense]MDC3959804.1 aminotransferase class I/II-fold pyridoxal phosphate-dependent enzyme [Polyangium jinanense]MDC3988051.1 aminotransferase class I/II-fold pyridoxal phosphate-dependent enzyme [Polyangium jinanense]
MPRPFRHPVPLEIGGAELRDLVSACMDRLAPWLDGLNEQPAHSLDGSHKVARAFDEPMPERGVPFRRVLARLFDRAIPVSLNPASPGYLGYIPGGGLPSTALADLIADITNRYTGLWMPAPGLVQLEISVIRWFCTLAGYGPSAGGWLCSGGSMANLAAVVTAREAKLGEDIDRGVLYTSEGAHHSISKAARVAGLPRRNTRVVPVDASFRLRRDELARAVAADRAAGLRPFMVVAQAGSTPVGAVDDLAALADVCAEEGIWLHVDAAYGGFFLLTARGRGALAGIERADSIALDPHKGLFLPYGTGCLLVKELATLRAAFSEAAAYLPPSQEDQEHWDFADLGLELSRPARGLRIWLPVWLHGASAFREALDEKLDLARDAAARVRALPGVRIVAEPELSLFAFRVEPPGMNATEFDAFNRRVLARVNQRKRLMLTGTTLRDPALGEEVFVIRVCVLCFRTHADRMDMLLEDLADAIADPRG